MKSLVSNIAGIVLLTGSLGVLAHNHTGQDYGSNKNIVETASENEQFSTLVVAIQQADLADALSGDGPFTVFAPTNAAFEKIPEEKLNSLLEEENKQKLQSILTYHVVPGKIMAVDLENGEAIETLNGENIEISLENGAQVNNVDIIQTDIMTDNGVIHVIDAVLLP